MTNAPSAELERWLQRRLDNEQWHWLAERIEKIKAGSPARDLHITLGMIPRKFGRADLALSKEEIAAARASRDNWNPVNWTIDAAARTLVLCSQAEHDEQGFSATYTDLCRTADLGESLTLYAALPLLPKSVALDQQIGEGLRTNIRAVFEAIAHNNPYPSEVFDQNRWNHMVLKALFIDSTLSPIQGLDERANAELATILCDYAHERWAAGRAITPELWRCVGPFAAGKMVDDLARVIESNNDSERKAGLLALAQSPDPTAAKHLKSYPDIHKQIADGTLTWQNLNLTGQSS